MRGRLRRRRCDQQKHQDQTARGHYQAFHLTYPPKNFHYLTTGVQRPSFCLRAPNQQPKGWTLYACYQGRLFGRELVSTGIRSTFLTAILPISKRRTCPTAGVPVRTVGAPVRTGRLLGATITPIVWYRGGRFTIEKAERPS